MIISAELSLYPLANEAYRDVILSFIERLNKYEGLEIHTNSMSTQIFGDYHQVMTAISRELEVVYQEVPPHVLVCKFINKDLRP
ncbi:MAG: YkoF-related protein [Idiomarinaceae bacterium HL-53]|nr:MAG: YkoF-related protein [Idiomarinaceae bacterium HL-53]CUS48142.1 Uncharacterized conserved protein YqgV, UPF0045/DUF77 family [Idiomarinaceae bacterium HL-53]